MTNNTTPICTIADLDAAIDAPALPESRATRRALALVLDTLLDALPADDYALIDYLADDFHDEPYFYLFDADDDPDHDPSTPITIADMQRMIDAEIASMRN